MHNKYILSICFCFTAMLQAIEVETEELAPIDKDIPWLTGPLLAPSGNVVPPGSLNIEPYLFIVGYTGSYDLQWHSHSSPIFWSYALNIPIQFGIAPRVDFTISPTVYYNKTQGKHTWGMGDLALAASLQLAQESSNFPAIKIGFQELFPTGQYSDLDPGNLFTDGSGSGSYISSIALVVSKLIHIKDLHFFHLRVTGAASFPSSVHLHGLTSYGGSPNTKGTYYPAQIMSVDIGLEYSFTRHWAGALDLLYNYATRSKFVGKNGQFLFSNVGGDLSEVSSQISLAPALEYNFSLSTGIIAGCWFTIAGRNTNIFRSGVIAFNYYK